MSVNNQSESNKYRIDVDVSEALKGLKAVTREAKKATEALKELKVVQDSDKDA
jgi:hypothetical protein